MAKIRLSEQELTDIIDESFKAAINENELQPMILFPITEESCVLAEGLIKSYPTDKVIDYMKRTFKLETELNPYISNPYNKYGLITCQNANNGTDAIIIAIRKNVGSAEEQILNAMTNLCGWEISCKVNNTPSAKFYPKWLIDYHDVFQFEKKIGDEATEEVLKRRYLYHVCPTSKLEKIKHIGLTPRDSTWEFFKHKGRIYFYLEKPYMKQTEKEFLSFKNVATSGYTLLVIDTEKLSKEIEFFYDPRQPKAVFTMQNIPPNAISVTN